MVSRNWLVFRRQGFSPPARRERRAYPPAVCEERGTTREAKRAAARRVAPKMAWGFVAPRSQIAADMLPRRASPQAILGATKHQPIARHHTSANEKAIHNGRLLSRAGTLNRNNSGQMKRPPSPRPSPQGEGETSSTLDNDSCPATLPARRFARALYWGIGLGSGRAFALIKSSRRGRS